MPADSTRYLFEISGLPVDVFLVERIQGTEILSDCYQFTVETLSTEVSLKYAELVGKEATITLRDSDSEVYRHGVIFHAEEEWTGAGTSRYSFQIGPKLKELNFGQNCRVFQKQSIVKISETILAERGLKEFKNATKKTYPEIDWIVQYNESDLHFLQRLWQEAGIFYYFDHGDSYEELILCDSNTGGKVFKEVFPYIEDSGMMETPQSMVRLSRHHSVKTGSVSLKDYFYEEPSTDIFASAEKEVGADHFSFGERTLNTGDATTRSEIMRQSLNVGRHLATGRTHSVDLGSGSIITLDQTCGPFKGEYIVTELRFRASQEATVTGGGEDQTFSAQVLLLESSEEYKAPLKYKKPQIPGFIVAKVDGKESPYAFLDDQGRYTAKLPFDLEESAEGGGSLPVRMNQPYGGPNYGMHFPAHAGNDLIIAFENGDIDRPMALGVAPNPSNASPVTSENKAISKIKTASGHEFIFDDTEKKELIQLLSKGLHSFKMEDEVDVQGITLQSTTEHKLHLDDKNKLIQLNSAEDGHKLLMDNENKFLEVSTKEGHILKLDETNKLIQLQSAKGHVLKLDDDGDLLTLADSKGKHTIQIDASGTISITTDGDLEWTAKGNLNVEAKDISMTAKGAFNVKATKDVAIEGMNVNAKGKQKTNIEAGMDLSLKGSMNLKMEGGMNVESKAGISNKMTGTMTNVESSAVNTIKGAMVMIN